MKIKLSKSQWQLVGKAAGWLKTSAKDWDDTVLVCPATKCRIVGHTPPYDNVPYEWAVYLWDGSFLDAYDTKEEAMRICTEVAVENGMRSGTWVYEKKKTEPEPQGEPMCDYCGSSVHHVDECPYSPSQKNTNW